MNQPVPALRARPPRRQPHPTTTRPHSRHIVATLLIGIICLASLLAAGTAMYASRGVKTDICGTVSNQVWGLKDTLQQDAHQLIPGVVKKPAMRTLNLTHKFMADHCPADTLAPPKPPEAPNGEINTQEIFQHLMKTMVQ